MHTIGIFLEFAVLGLIGLIMVTIVLKMLNGQIRTAGMLSAEIGGPVIPERLLVMMGTLAAAFGYVIYCLKTGAANGSLPDFSTDLATALGGGNLFYIIGKRFRR